jgi:glycosyltransferase involved in cell wall biosynthesis
MLDRLIIAHDVVLIHNHTYLSSVTAALAARRRRRAVVLLQHSPFVEYRFPWNVVERAADRLLGQLTLRSARRILAVSGYTRQYVQQLIGDRPVTVIHSGVDTRRFSPVTSAAEKTRLRARLGWPEDCFVLFTLRRLVFRNGLDLLLTACARLKDRHDIAVIIGGGGPERQVLERVIRRERLDNVRLVGRVPEALLPDCYRAADAFAFPSRTGEGFGLVLLEAFSSGLPAIVTRGGGQEEIVQEGRSGFLVPASAPEALAAAIIGLQRDPQRARVMGAAARASAVERDWERHVDQLVEVLREAARG